MCGTYNFIILPAGPVAVLPVSAFIGDIAVTISKFTLFSSAIGAGMGYLALLGVLNSSLSVAYYARVIMTLLSGEPGKDVQVGEASPIMVLVTLAMALVIIWLGLFPGGLTALANEATKPLFEGLTQYIGAVLG